MSDQAPSSCFKLLPRFRVATKYFRVVPPLRPFERRGHQLTAVLLTPLERWELNFAPDAVLARAGGVRVHDCCKDVAHDGLKSLALHAGK